MGFRRRLPLMPGDDRHGTNNGYQNHGCRCGRCTAAHNAYQRDLYSRKKTGDVMEARPSKWHGSAGAYRNGCRCDLCRAGHAQRCASQRAGRPMLLPDDPRHGTSGGYSNHNCRCGRCREAYLASRRRRKAG